MFARLPKSDEPEGELGCHTGEFLPCSAILPFNPAVRVLRKAVPSESCSRVFSREVSIAQHTMRLTSLPLPTSPNAFFTALRRAAFPILPGPQISEYRINMFNSIDTSCTKPYKTISTWVRRAGAGGTLELIKAFTLYHRECFQRALGKAM